MIIKFLDKQYEVIQKIKGTDFLDLYVADDLNQAERKPYTIACVKDSELIKKLIPITTKKNTSLSFKDLHDSFNADGKYYIVFNYAGGRTFRQAMQENDYHLPERLLLMKNIMNQILILNMPDCFIYEALRKDSIVVDDAMGIRFNYFFTEVDYYGQVNEKSCLRRIGELVQELFQKELTGKSSAELTEFHKNLVRERYEDMWECYEAFNNIYDRLKLQSEKHEVRPKRVWWRAWDGIKKRVPALKAMFAVFIVLISGAFLLLHLPNPVLSEDGISFQRIGTLEIREQNESHE